MTTLLAITVTHHNGVRVAEIGELLGALGGLVMLLGGFVPFAKRIGQTVGGAAICGGFVMLLFATHWGHFH